MPKKVSDVLAGAAKKTKKPKKKSSVQEVNIPSLSEPVTNNKAQKLREELDNISGTLSPELVKSIRIEGEFLGGVTEQWLRANKDEKDAKARKAQAESQILPLAEKERLNACENSGFTSSINVNGAVVVSASNRYSKISPDDLERIEGLFGENHEEFFESVTTVSLTDEALADEDIVAKLIDAVGEENFSKYFEVNQHISPTEELHRRRATSKSVRAKADKLIEEGILKPSKSAVKPA